MNSLQAVWAPAKRQRTQRLESIDSQPLSAAALWVAVAPGLAARRFCRDADDDRFVHAALTASAGWIISGDADLLEMAPVAGLRVVTPAAAMAEALFANE